ncbi:MAG TPA: hypothetical protein V6D25_13995 [Leptolyngbyaceae cyanobacterium]
MVVESNRDVVRLRVNRVSTTLNYRQAETQISRSRDSQTGR